MRTNGYERLRSLSKTSASLSDLKPQLHDVDISTFRIAQGSSLIGKTLAQIELRGHYGISVVAIQRDSQIVSNPDADTLLHTDDLLFVLGSSERISEAVGIFSPSDKGNESS